MSLHYLSESARSLPGIEFCARTLLRMGVGLLGARVTAQQIMHFGWVTAMMVICGVVTTTAIGVLVGKRLGFTSAQSVLACGAVAICGASGALAISAVLPRDKDSDRHTLMVAVAVTFLSTLAMVLYPLLASTLSRSADLGHLHRWHHP